MSERIDAALEKAQADGLKPMEIHVGPGLYDELFEEQNIIAAELLSQPGQTAGVHSPVAVTEYEGLKVVKRKDEPDDYLEIL